jgi:hypothetical protein
MIHISSSPSAGLMTPFLWMCLNTPVGRLIRQELLDAMATMDGSAIPDDDHLAGDLAQQVLEKRDDVVRVDGVVLAAEVQLAFWVVINR